MPRITFIEHNGTEHVVDADPGVTLMEAARSGNIAGIVAECGGACACATCQVYVPDEWQSRTGGPSEDEAAMLEFAEHVRPNSRLSCQITLTDALDGLSVSMPANQQ